MTISAKTTASRLLSHAPGTPLTAAFRLCCAALLFAGLAACKVEMTVPVGGKLVGSDGTICLTGETCVVDISDDRYDHSFQGVPDAGYVFKGWRNDSGFVCWNQPGVCRLNTTGLGGHANLMSIIESDQTFFLEPVFARAGYDTSYWRQVETDLKQKTYATNQYLYSALPDVGNCDPGALSTAARTRAQEAANKLRALHFLPALSYDTAFDAEAQATNLVQEANNYLTHYPKAGDTCYTAAGRTGASSSNLSSGPQVDPVADIVGWANDNHNAAAIMEAGHRRWLLKPDLGYISYGQVFGSASQKVFGFGRPAATNYSGPIDYVAFPYRNYPYMFISSGNSPTPWSLSIIPEFAQQGSFDYFSEAEVKVRERVSKTYLTVDNLHYDNKGYGVPNFLSWYVESWQYDTEYVVDVFGVKMPSGETRTISYLVLVDRYGLVTVEEPLESSDSGSEGLLSGLFDTSKDADSYTVFLEGNVSFYGDSEYSNQAFYILVYDAGKNLVKRSHQAFDMTFAPGVYTVVASPCNEYGGCYTNVQTYSITY